MYLTRYRSCVFTEAHNISHSLSLHHLPPPNRVSREAEDDSCGMKVPDSFNSSYRGRADNRRRTVHACIRRAHEWLAISHTEEEASNISYDHSNELSASSFSYIINICWLGMIRIILCVTPVRPNLVSTHSFSHASRFRSINFIGEDWNSIPKPNLPPSTWSATTATIPP
jgi:hypothetical protein